MPGLFVKQDFTSHAGLELHWKIDCDALSDDEITCIALMLSEVLHPFHSVYGVPRGGTRLANALWPYATADHTGVKLIVDDVLTTGKSMETARSLSIAQTNQIHGAVIFARGPVAEWIVPLFRMPH